MIKTNGLLEKLCLQVGREGIFFNEKTMDEMFVLTVNLYFVFKIKLAKLHGQNKIV